MTVQTVEDFDDEVLTEAQAARMAGLSLATFKALEPGLRPCTLWRSDVQRWLAWLASCRKRGHGIGR